MVNSSVARGGAELIVSAPYLRRIRVARLAPICKTGVGSSCMVLHFLIQGRVQGVGFRWFVQREASELDLRGWVRNTEEGDVEVVAAGEPGDLDELARQPSPRPARRPRRPPGRASF